MRAVYLLPLLAAVLWSWSFVATKVLIRYLSVVEIIGVRLVLAVPPMLALVLLRGLCPRLTPRDGRVLLGGAGILFLHFLVQFSGLRYTTATQSGWIIAVAPISIAILARAFLGERIGRTQVVGMGIATAGIVLLVSGGDLSGLRWLSHGGDWLILASTFTWAGFTVATRDLSRRHSPLGVATLILAACGLAALAIMVFTSRSGALLSLPLEGILAALFLAFFSTFLAFWFWQEGVARIGASRSGFFLYVMPLATMALAVPYLHETFGWMSAAGGALVLSGVALAERKK
ncbi:MAG: DMT family transporter [Candidatus Eisenbacteria bacterium]